MCVPKTAADVRVGESKIKHTPSATKIPTRERWGYFLNAMGLMISNHPPQPPIHFFPDHVVAPWPVDSLPSALFAAGFCEILGFCLFFAASSSGPSLAT